MNRIIGGVGGALLASIAGAGIALADNHNGDGGGLAVGAFLLLGLAVGAVIYFVPSIIGFKQGHQNAVAIFALNLLAGWTFIGWVGSFVWSLTEVRKS